MADLLYDFPPRAILPLSKGEDVDVTFVYKTLVVDVEGDPVLDGSGKKQFVEEDFPDDAVVTLVIDIKDAEAEGVINGARARCIIDHTLVDKCRDGTLWRMVMTTPDTIDRVLVNGITRRSDGA